MSLNYSLDKCLDIDERDVFFSSSDIGWVVGHSFNVYGPLLRGATGILYEGKPVGTPDSGAYWKII
jgi:propionyl-CoA synthetase